MHHPLKKNVKNISIEKKRRRRNAGDENETKKEREKEKCWLIAFIRFEVLILNLILKLVIESGGGKSIESNFPPSCDKSAGVQKKGEKT